MRKLGEQWVEEIDGIKHMLKLVPEVDGCRACFYYGEWDECVVHPNAQCTMETIIKDLGILNEDGCLPSSWGGYPEVIRVGKPNFVTYFRVSLVVKYSDGSGIQVHVTGKTRQQAIDAWNRRA